MSGWEFFQGKLLHLCFLGIGAFLTAAVLFIAEVPPGLTGILELLFFLLVAGWLLVDFGLEKRRIKRLEKLLEGLPEGYLLGEILPMPQNGIEKKYFEIMKKISRSAIGSVEQARKEKEEYCDYVESWIHEIKTPLTACTLILSNHGAVGKLKSELKRADNLTENILYYARLRSAWKDTQIRKFSVAETIEEAVKSQMEILIAAKISVETEGDFFVYSDHKALCFILKQLFVNCAKYCPGCQVKIKAKEGQIVVEDNGIGIPLHEVERVTERGFTGTNGRKLGGSTGMGLYIVSQMCLQLGIMLKIESREGAFTRIFLNFEKSTAALTNL